MSHAAQEQESGRGGPLTVLNEEEELFRQTVASFANDRVRPLVGEMDRAEKVDADIVKELFELGLMGIEIPEEYGGSGASFFMACLAVEELSRVDPGFEIDLLVRSPLRTMTAIWMGLAKLRSVIDAGNIELDGDPSIASAMQRWLGFSPFARESSRRAA